MQRLKYTEYRGCKDIIAIDLHNDYTIIAIKSWDKEKEKYKVEFRITEDTVDRWKLIYELDSIEFNTDHRTINSVILKYVANLLRDGFFDYYIQEYEYELECFDRGNDLFESERLGENNV